MVRVDTQAEQAIRGYWRGGGAISPLRAKTSQCAQAHLLDHGGDGFGRRCRGGPEA